VPTANLNSQIISLVRLQELDSEIYGLKIKKESIPEQIKALESAFEEKKRSLATLESAFLDLQKQRKEKELELASKEEANKKLQGQLYGLKTNKEYQVMLGQINDAKADASVIEDKILLLFEQADKVKRDIEEEKSRLKDEERVFLQKKKEIEDAVKVIDDRLNQLQAGRSQALTGIEANLLSQYDRILRSRDGLAIVKVKDNSCQGCNMSLPPQVINLIKMYERVITCEVCNRILYIEE
jgi:predicted  nucleic acid-binding Zn-ribbon protein